MNDFSVPMIFSPQNCSLELLEATLTPKRRQLAEDLVGRLEDACRNGRASRNLLIGPRGSGKTHVLSYVRGKLNERCRDGAPLVVIPLSEEERSIARLLDFLLACIRALNVPVSETMARIRAVPRAAATEEALSILREQTAGKNALIVVENFDAMLARVDEGGIGALRAFFQGEPRISLLASATRLFESSDRADHPFYGFFLLHPLPALDRREAREFLRLLAEWRDDKELAALLGTRRGKARVSAIYDLTGGNHRLLAMLSLFLKAEDLNDLVGPLVQMVDRQLTPYYQQRLDRLSALQNTVLRAIVDISSAEDCLGRAVALAEIIDYTGLSSQHCSRILFDLKYENMVRSIRRGRESLYELNEPLLRLMLDMKEGRRRPLPLIVNILRLWYGVKELRDLADAAPTGVRDYYLEAARGTALASRGLSKEPLGAFSTSRAEWRDSDGEAASTGTAGILSTGDDAEAARLNDEGVALGRDGQHEQALAVFDGVVERFGSREEPALQKQVARALLEKGSTLRSLDRSAEALAVYDGVVERFGSREEPALQELVAWVLVNKGATLNSLGRSAEALAVYDGVVERFGSRGEPALEEQVAWALVNKGVALGSLDRSEEALAVYDVVVERFGSREEPALQEQVARALVDKGARLGLLGRSEEALAAFMTVLDRAALREEFRLHVVKSVISTLSRQAALLEKGVSALKQDAESLSGGLMRWIQGLLPMSEEDAESLGACESVLRRVLADVPSCQPALQMLGVIRRDALGDNRALLELPLELRRLIRADDGETQGAPRGTHDAPGRGRDGRRKGAKM